MGTNEKNEPKGPKGNERKVNKAAATKAVKSAAPITGATASVPSIAPAKTDQVLEMRLNAIKQTASRRQLNDDGSLSSVFETSQNRTPSYGPKAQSAKEVQVTNMSTLLIEDCLK